ncbi:MAG: response regulator transcription factor [Ignavibacteriaceae bacterium]
MPGLKVFIVDDALSIRDSLKKLISKLSLIEIMSEAGSIAEARNKLNQICPDITILDLNLPDGSGIELLKEIKSGPNPHTVIMLTNYSAEQYRKKSIECGADYFLDKSTEFEHVKNILDSLIK